MKPDLISKIKGHGYWRINFQPLVMKDQLTLEQCSEIVRKNAVKLRGWDFPHFPQRQNEETGMEPCGSYYQGWIDWWAHKEFWRMYKGGQFLCYVALLEDWYGEDGWFAKMAEKVKPDTVVNVIGSVEYEVLEFFEFLSRLCENGLYKEGVNISISLHNIRGRTLFIDDSNRVPLFHDRRTGADEYVFTSQLTPDAIIKDVKGLSKKVILEVFDIFGWHNPPMETVDRDIDQFLSGRR